MPPASPLRLQAARDCPSCGFTLPCAAFPVTGHSRSKFCGECQSVRFLSQRVLAITAAHSVLIVGTCALLRLGYTVAAQFILEHQPGDWPTLQAARAAQRRA